MICHGLLPNVQAYQTLIYRRALHPDLFTLKARRQIKFPDGEAEAWIVAGGSSRGFADSHLNGQIPVAGSGGGHVIRFRLGSFCCTELVTDQQDMLPIEGAVTAFPCAGEHEFEHHFEPQHLQYVTSVQTETLSESLYHSTYNEILELGKEVQGVMFAWDDADQHRYASRRRSDIAINTSIPHTSLQPVGTASNGHAAVAVSHSSNGHTRNGLHMPIHTELTRDSVLHDHRSNGFGHISERILASSLSAAVSTQNLSMLEISRIDNEVHIQGYHLIGFSGFVLRTQSMFALQTPRR